MKKELFTRGIPLIIIVIFISVFAVLYYQPAATDRLPDDSINQDRSILTLRDLNRAFIDIAAKVKPTVVTVSTERLLSVRQGNPFGLPFSNDPFLDFFFGPRQKQDQSQERQYRQEGLGSGVIVSSDGQILTNNHVVRGADSIYVRTYDGKRYKAKIVGVDSKTDIAVLKIDARSLPAITIGDSDKLQVGEIVMAIGSPMSVNLAYTVTQGIVSAKGRSNVGLADYEDFIQTDAAINQGNSGGPLVNLDGDLVGINTAIVSQSGGFQGIGFAIPSNMATGVMKSLIADGKVIRGWLGVSIQDINEQIAGALGLSSAGGTLGGDVSPNSPASEAGIEAGDVITALDKRRISNSAQLSSQIAVTAPGTRVTLTILRDDREMDINVKLGELPGETAQVPDSGEIEQRLGFAVKTLTRELAGNYGLDRVLSGVVVTSIDPAGNAYQAGLREGDLIRSINKERITSEDQFYAKIKNMKKGDTVLLRITRQDRAFYIAFTF
ncbi:MAG: DegQ family serine endoprotease [candidate division Zixibacteria bacterium]|nr:DegQ family serine endoprotease [candidate division Zixibacteria bacterium]